MFFTIINVVHIWVEPTFWIIVCGLRMWDGFDGGDLRRNWGCRGSMMYLIRTWELFENVHKCCEEVCLWLGLFKNRRFTYGKKFMWGQLGCWSGLLRWSIRAPMNPTPLRTFTSVKNGVWAFHDLDLMDVVQSSTQHYNDKTIGWGIQFILQLF